MQEIVKALIKARASFKAIPKDRTNPHFKSSYATLDAVLDAVQPGLDSAGLAIAQLIETIDGSPYLATYLMHESGEHLKSLFPLPEISFEKEVASTDSPSVSREKTSNDPQKLGSAITYARRYSLCAILSVTADEDDDGNSVSHSSSGQSQQLAKAGKPGCISEKQISRLMAISKQSGLSIEGLKVLVKKHGYNSRAEIKYGESYDAICKEAEDTELASYYNGIASGEITEEAA